jgi:hypothetical protein
MRANKKYQYVSLRSPENNYQSIELAAQEAVTQLAPNLNEVEQYLFIHVRSPEAIAPL